ncbi:MAG: T9SS type A sorting domain-containing protein [Flavobacteriales bacterium]
MGLKFNLLTGKFTIDNDPGATVHIDEIGFDWSNNDLYFSVASKNAMVLASNNFSYSTLTHESELINEYNAGSVMSFKKGIKVGDVFIVNIDKSGKYAALRIEEIVSTGFGNRISVRFTYKMIANSVSVLANDNNGFAFVYNGKSKEIQVDGIESVSYISVFDLQGNIKIAYWRPTVNIISLDSFPSGLYLVKVVLSDGLELKYKILRYD